MVASIIMLIGLLGLAGLQIVGVRANNIGKRMSQASLLASDLEQNMQIWQYSDTRLTPQNQAGTFTDTNAAGIAKYWDLKNLQQPTAADGTAVTFDYTDGTSYATVTNALAANYLGVLSPVDTTLAAGDQTIFQRFWNVYLVDLTGSGTAQGKLVQIVVRWHEPSFGWRSVSHSFFKYDPTLFNQ